MKVMASANVCDKVEATNSFGRCWAHTTKYDDSWKCINDNDVIRAVFIYLAASPQHYTNHNRLNETDARLLLLSGFAARKLLRSGHCKEVVFVLMSLRCFEFVICIRFSARNLLWFWSNAVDEVSTLEVRFNWWMMGSVALRCCDERFSENQRYGKVNKFLALHVNSSRKIDTNCESCAIEWNRLMINQLWWRQYSRASMSFSRRTAYNDIYYDCSGAFRCPDQLRNIIHC